MLFTISKKSPLLNLQFLHEIKVIFIDFWFRGFFFKFSFIKYHFPQFLSPIRCPIWSNLKRSFKIFLIACGFDPYLPLYPSIHELFLKLVSLHFVLNLDRVYSTTTWSRLVSYIPIKSPLFFWYGTIFLFISSQVMWRYRKRSIRTLNWSHQSSLKWAGTWHTLIGW